MFRRGRSARTRSTQRTPEEWFILINIGKKADDFRRDVHDAYDESFSASDYARQPWQDILDTPINQDPRALALDMVCRAWRSSKVQKGCDESDFKQCVQSLLQDVHERKLRSSSDEDVDGGSDKDRDTDSGEIQDMPTGSSAGDNAGTGDEFQGIESNSEEYETLPDTADDDSPIYNRHTTSPAIPFPRYRSSSQTISSIQGLEPDYENASNSATNHSTSPPQIARPQNRRPTRTDIIARLRNEVQHERDLKNQFQQQLHAQQDVHDSIYNEVQTLRAENRNLKTQLKNVKGIHKRRRKQVEDIDRGLDQALKRKKLIAAVAEEGDEVPGSDEVEGSLSSGDE